MKLIDTHAHLYLDEFELDINDVIHNAIDSGVEKFLLPNIDNGSIDSLKKLAKKFPNNVFPMMGLHPTSVKEDFKTQLEIIKNELNSEKYYAVGEIGIDLYWDKTFFEQQKEAFRYQLILAIEKNLPIAIHSRESHEAIIKVLDEFKGEKLSGVFHCFSGDLQQAKQVVERGFLLGIGGVVTFKNSGLSQVVEQIGIENLVIETDAPFLSPTPYRGKRNESKYCVLIAQKMAEILNINIEEVARITSENAQKLFKI